MNIFRRFFFGKHQQINKLNLKIQKKKHKITRLRLEMRIDKEEIKIIIGDCLNS